MRSLILASNLNQIGGISRYNRNLFNALNELNGDVVLVELNDTSITSKIKFSLDFFSKALSFRPDLIVCTHINFSPLCYILSFFKKTNYLISAYGIEVWDIKNPIFKRALRNARAVIAISRYTRDRLVGQSIDLKKIYLLPNCVDGDRFKPSPKEAKLVNKLGCADQKIILTVTRLLSSEAYKGCDKIIEALPAVIRNYPNTKYIIVGRGDDLPRLEKLAQTKKVNGSVVFVRDVPDDDLVAYYNVCDVFAMPSRGEGFGFVFIEALACGKPVIGGGADGSRDALLDGELGMIVNPNSPNEISTALLKILEGGAPAKLVNANYLRDKVLSYYGKDKFSQRLTEILHEIS